jgi:DNA transformation protein
MNLTSKNTLYTINEAIQALSPFGSISYRPMFGGYGIYKEGIIIALLAENQLYFKSVPESEPYYQSFGSIPFVHEGKLRPVKMSYWLLPSNVLTNDLLLGEWVDTAYQAALTAQKRKKPPKKGGFNYIF